jgi:Protein of unknown function (DUF3313)
MSRRTLRAWVTSALTATVLFGCRAAPAPSVGFADPTVLKKSDPTVPFDRFWHKPDVNWKSYDKIYVAEINVSYMLKMTAWQKGERQEDIEKDVKQLSVYTRNSIIKAFREDPNHRFQVIDNPTHDPHALVFEMALIEAVPSKVLLNVLGYAPFYVGTAISVVRGLANDKSSAAFESCTRDAATGEVLILAADRETEQYAPVDLRGLTWYSDIDGIIDVWSKQFVQIANQKPGEKIANEATFRLLPW